MIRGGLELGSEDWETAGTYNSSVKADDLEDDEFGGPDGWHNP